MNMKSEIVNAFKTALLWSSTGTDDRPLDDSYTLSDFSPEAEATISTIVDRFMVECLDLVNDMPLYSYSDAGHDLWLTLAGHGCGFWEQETHGDTLTAWAHQYRHLGDTYVGDDFKIYFLAGELK